MNPTFKQVTKTRYVQLVSELAQEIFVQHYTKLTPKVAAALADKYQSDILTDDEIHSGVINYFLIYLGTEPVGYFALDLGPAGAMCLSRLFLKEKARGQGIGRSIVAYAQKLAEGDGRSRLYMRVWARDLKAEGFAKNYAVTPGNVHEIVQHETGLVFSRVLEHAGVYKRTPEGRAAFLRFVEAL